MHEEKVIFELHKNAMLYFKQILEAVTHKTVIVHKLSSSLTNYPSKTNKTRSALREK